jgi:uncharacterized protein (DUF433 family)
MSEIARITVDPNQCGGRPCVRGLRIRVKDILELLAAGASREEILTDFPLLEAADITAALEYAARSSGPSGAAPRLMRFLVDAQLPPALARWRASQGHVAEHVADCKLETRQTRRSGILRWGPPLSLLRRMKTSRGAKRSA